MQYLIPHTTVEALRESPKLYKNKENLDRYFRETPKAVPGVDIYDNYMIMLTKKYIGKGEIDKEGNELKKIEESKKIEVKADEPKVEEKADESKIEEKADESKIDEKADESKIEEKGNESKFDERAD